MRKEGKKRGQITLFIIIGVLIVAAILLVLFFTGKIRIQPSEKFEPGLYVDKCARDAVSESIEQIYINGGRVKSTFNIYYAEDVYNYLCYQNLDYVPCVNQYPMLKSIVEEEIKNDTIDDVNLCIQNLKEDLKNKGYEISEGPLSYKIVLNYGQVFINIDKQMTIKKAGEVKNFENFNTYISSPLYEIIMIAREIVNQEARYCNFEYNGFMILYPQYKITRMEWKGSRLYHVIDRETEKDFKFAVKSCTLPGGM